jgi:hypothetical protein
MNSFRKSRSPRVAARIRSLISLYHKQCDTKGRKPILSELKKICWFDQKSQRTFLDKLIKFNKVTLGVDISTHLDCHISNFEAHCMHRSYSDAQKFYKKLLYVGTRICTSNSFEPLDFVKTNSIGEPKLFGPLLELMHGSLNERRSAITVLKVIELVELWSGNFEPGKITEEWKVLNTPIEDKAKVGNYFRSAFKKLPRSVQRKYSIERICKAFKMAIEQSFPRKDREKRNKKISGMSTLHFSGHNGPNGPCLSTIVLDYEALAYPGNENLLYAIKKFAVLTSNTELVTALDNFELDTTKVVTNLNDSNKRPIHSKISLKEESWGRLRPFAITDWFSHSSLRGLHNYLYRWLEVQEEDGTMDQDKVSEVARIWTMDQDIHPESADLSSATDSIPVCVQEEILTCIVGAELSKLWRIICTDRDFLGPDGSNIRYCMGQPMGISSSWPMLAVWNHIMNRTAIHYNELSGNPLSKEINYLVIGDDDATRSKEIFDFYQFICSDLQGVGISLMKGFHSEHQHQLNQIPEIGLMKTAELAKRIFCSGHEITPMTPKEVKTAFEDTGQFPELLFDMSKRGYNFTNRMDVPKLTALAREPKLALLLLTNPVRIAPPFTEGDYSILESTHPFSTVVWFKYHEHYVELSKQLLVGTYESVISTLMDNVTLIQNWKKVASSESTTINSKWNYVSDAQASLLQVIIKIADTRSYELLLESYPMLYNIEEDPQAWVKLHKIVRTFQTLYDVAHFYGDGKKSREDSYKFATRYLTTLIKVAVAKLEHSLSQVDGSTP